MIEHSINYDHMIATMKHNNFYNKWVSNGRLFGYRTLANGHYGNHMLTYEGIYGNVILSEVIKTYHQERDPIPLGKFIASDKYWMVIEHLKLYTIKSTLHHSSINMADEREADEKEAEISIVI